MGIGHIGFCICRVVGLGAWSAFDTQWEEPQTELIVQATFALHLAGALREQFFFVCRRMCQVAHVPTDQNIVGGL